MGSGRARGILRKMQVLRLRPSGFAQDDNSFALHRVSDSPGIRRKTTEILRSAQNDERSGDGFVAAPVTFCIGRVRC